MTLHTPHLCSSLPHHQECHPSGTHRCSCSFLFSRTDWKREEAWGECLFWGVQRSQPLPGVRAGVSPWDHGTYNGLHRASSSKWGEKRGLLGVRRQGQAGRRWALTSSSVLPPCSCSAFCRSSTWARSSNSCCWFSLRGWMAAQCLRPPSACLHACT